MNRGTLKPILVITVAALAVALSLADAPTAGAGGASGGPGILGGGGAGGGSAGGGGAGGASAGGGGGAGGGGAGMVSRDAETVSFGGATASGTGQLATVSSAQVQFDSLWDRLKDIGYTWIKESLKAATSPYIDWRSLLKLKPEIEKTTEIITAKERREIEMWAEELRTTTIDEVIKQIRVTSGFPGLPTRELKRLLQERAEKEGIEVK